MGRIAACLRRAALVAGVVALALSGAIAHAQPTGGAIVAFTSQDAAGAPLQMRGMLWMPAGAPKGGVVLVHGSSGWTDHTVGHYARAFSAAGYAALAFDALGSRGVTSTVEDQSRVQALHMTRDAFAARRFLVARGVAPDRIGIMGFSKGGIVALYAADRNFLPDEAERFRVALPYYPGCVVRPRVPKPAAEVYMALGEKDDWSGVKPCQVLADDFARAGGKITVKVYPGATHGWDGNPAATGMIYLRDAENYSECMVYLEEDGQVVHEGKRYGPNDAALIAELRKSCVKKGARLWTNPDQKAAGTQDAIAFLDRTIGQ
jgi:dienelactone hydrolase